MRRCKEVKMRSSPSSWSLQVYFVLNFTISYIHVTYFKDIYSPFSPLQFFPSPDTTFLTRFMCFNVLFFYLNISYNVLWFCFLLPQLVTDLPLLSTPNSSLCFSPPLSPYALPPFVSSLHSLCGPENLKEMQASMSHRLLWTHLSHEMTFWSIVNVEYHWFFNLPSILTAYDICKALHSINDKITSSSILTSFVHYITKEPECCIEERLTNRGTIDLVWSISNMFASIWVAFTTA